MAAVTADDKSVTIRIVEAGIPLLGMVAAGWACARWKVIDETGLHWINKMVFWVGIPSLVFRALSNTVFSALPWEFFLAFLLVRVVMLMVAASATGLLEGTPLGGDDSDFSGRLVTHWMGTTWTNSVIFGIPIVSAIYGAKFGALLNVVAAMSSFVFQLPVMLTIYEMRKASGEHPYAEHTEGTEADAATAGAGAGAGAGAEASGGRSGIADAAPTAGAGDVELGAAGKAAAEGRPATGAAMAAGAEGSSHDMAAAAHATPHPHHAQSTRQVVARVAFKVLVNPVFLAILLGIVLSLILTEAGEKLPLVVDTFCTNMGSIVTPCAAFCVGLFSDGSTAFLKHTGFRTGGLHIFSKMVLMPAIACVMVVLVGLKGMQARSLVLIASLPGALASFTLSKTYGKGQALMTSNIVVGTLLMLPVALFWDWLVTQLSLGQ